tara:strand:+ start:480 stop:689 length:210 start_codon:yes stop_codon:yes gene_type:complete
MFNVLVLNPLTMSYDVVKGNLPIIQAAELKKQLQDDNYKKQQLNQEPPKVFVITEQEDPDQYKIFKEVN